MKRITFTMHNEETAILCENNKICIPYLSWMSMKDADALYNALHKAIHTSSTAEKGIQPQKTCNIYFLGGSVDELNCDTDLSISQIKDIAGVQKVFKHGTRASIYTDRRYKIKDIKDALIRLAE